MQPQILEDNLEVEGDLENADFLPQPDMNDGGNYLLDLGNIGLHGHPEKSEEESDEDQKMF